jgi:hypothetical protein
MTGADGDTARRAETVSPKGRLPFGQMVENSFAENASKRIGFPGWRSQNHAPHSRHPRWLGPAARALLAGSPRRQRRLRVRRAGDGQHRQDHRRRRRPAQTRCVIETIRSVVQAAGGTLDDVAYNAIFLRDLADYAAMNEVYAEYFGNRPPARYCIKAELVRPEFLVEISSIAHLPKQDGH